MPLFKTVPKYLSIYLSPFLPIYQSIGDKCAGRCEELVHFIDVMWNVVISRVCLCDVYARPLISRILKPLCGSIVDSLWPKIELIRFSFNNNTNFISENEGVPRNSETHTHTHKRIHTHTHTLANTEVNSFF